MTVPAHPCSALCRAGTHVDLAYVSPAATSLTDPGGWIARQWAAQFGVEVIECRPAHEAPRPWETGATPVPVVGHPEEATEPWMIRWRVR